LPEIRNWKWSQGAVQEGNPPADSTHVPGPK